MIGTIPPSWRWVRDHGKRDAAVACFASGVAAVEPDAAVSRALAQRDDAQAFSRIIALGKAAVPMANAATRWQRRSGDARVATLVVCQSGAAGPSSGLTLLHGDHPVPDRQSVTAADALGDFASRLAPTDRVLLLLSGGTSSLIGAPISAVSLKSLQQIFRMLLASGFDIHTANLVRKRFLAWGAGRLARALMPAGTTALAISDVMGDQPATIGSGPVSPDPATAESVANLLADGALQLPADALGVLTAMRTGNLPETPKPGAPCFEKVAYQVIASNRLALEAAAATARGYGFDCATDPDGLSGEASTTGQALARRLLDMPAGGSRAFVAGGETTVTLGSSSGTGGRSQELALAASRVLDGSRNVLLLAAGTDGHDGASGNAGAIVDGETWCRIPGADALLARHDSGTALAQAGALLGTGPTGTNVMDLVIGFRW
jgi:hydroxypyruvate reductase